MKQTPCTLQVNGDPYQIMVDPGANLLSILREKLNLTGTKDGCSMGECGACTVLINGKPMMSCLVLALEAQGEDIQTIEGVAAEGQLHPLQHQFVEEGAAQCGFCTPGMIMSAKALLDKGTRASQDQIKHALAGNHCRCTGYTKIISAVEKAQEQVTHD